MPKKRIVDIIRELNHLLLDQFKDFKGSYLYGSSARGDESKDSDIDIVAIFEHIDREKELEICGIITDLDYKYDVFISLFPYTPEELRQNPVYYDEVVNKGFFYEAAA